MELLFKAVEDNDLIKVKKLLNAENINAIDSFGYSLLHVSSFKNHNEISLLLIDQGIDVNLQDKNGQTILHYAALNNQLAVARSALKNGAKLSIQDIHGNQPLWTAVFNDKGRNERIEIIGIFLEWGADVNHKNKVDKTPKDIVRIAGYSNLKPLMGMD